MKSNKRRGIAPSLAQSLAATAANVAEAKTEMRATPEAAKYREEQGKLVAKITAATNSAKRIEDLIFLEMALQKMDMAQAQTEQEIGSIQKAQTAYQELLRTVDQMRRSPEEYSEANLSISSQEPEKIPDVRGPAKLRSNLARLQNRAMFATEEDRGVWEARVGLAHATGNIIKTMHKDALKATHD